MRYLILALFLVTSIPSYAASAESLQAALRQQMESVKQQSQGRLKLDGDITVKTVGVDQEVTYPTMRATVADGLSSWVIPSIHMTLQNAANTADKMPLKLVLPDTIQQVHKDGTVLRRVVLNGQAITGDWSQKENTIERLDAKIASVTWTDLYSDTTTTAQSLAAQTLTKFDGSDKVSMLMHAQGANFDRQPANAMTGIMPKSLNATGQIKNLPKALAVLGAVMPLPGLQASLAQIGTQLTLDDLNVVTNNGAKLTGNGWFKAAATGSKLPVSGRANLEWQNLQQVLTSLQQGVTSGQGNAQSMLMIMMLQGMGKSVNQKTSYVVDLTPEGQILLNDRDVTSLFMGGQSLLGSFQPKSKQTAPKAMPTAKVTDEGAI